MNVKSLVSLYEKNRTKKAPVEANKTKNIPSTIKTTERVLETFQLMTESKESTVRVKSIGEDSDLDSKVSVKSLVCNFQKLSQNTILETVKENGNTKLPMKKSLNNQYSTSITPSLLKQKEPVDKIESNTKNITVPYIKKEDNKNNLKKNEPASQLINTQDQSKTTKVVPQLQSKINATTAFFNQKSTPVVVNKTAKKAPVVNEIKKTTLAETDNIKDLHTVVKVVKNIDQDILSSITKSIDVQPSNNENKKVYEEKTKITLPSVTTIEKIDKPIPAEVKKPIESQISELRIEKLNSIDIMNSVSTKEPVSSNKQVNEILIDKKNSNLSMDEESNSKTVSYSISAIPSEPEIETNLESKASMEIVSVIEECEEDGDIEIDDNESDDKPLAEGVSELPFSYNIDPNGEGRLNLILPSPPARTILKKTNTKEKKDKNVIFSNEDPISHETYNMYEYFRADEDLDIQASSAEYEFEKMLDKMDKIEVTVTKTSDQRLGIQVYGMGMRKSNSKDHLAIYVKSVTPGSPCDQSGNIKEDDLIIEMNGTNLLGVNIPIVNETIKSAGNNIKLLLAREVKE